jgi:hypothetical protein
MRAKSPGRRLKARQKPVALPLIFFVFGNLVGVESLQVFLGEEAVEEQPNWNQHRNE